MLIALLLAVTLDDATGATSSPAIEPVPVATSAATSPMPAPLRGLVLAPAAPQDQDTQRPRGLCFVWRDHPSIRAGRNLRLDLRLKIQQDGRNPGDEPDDDFEPWELQRFRAGIDGELFRKIQFSIEREFTERLNVDESGTPQKSQWKDLWVEANIDNTFQVRLGKFKVPFGLDQVSGESELDFIYRSLGGDYLSPGRDIGVEVHGRFFDRGLNYWFGGFQQDGENSRSRRVAGGDRTYAGRLTTVPFRKWPVLGEAEVGGSFATTELSDASLLPNGLRGRTVMSQYTFFDPVFVKGTRRRYGVELDWIKNHLGVRAEYMLASDTRTDQGLADQDLSNARSQAYYVSGIWVLTGEKLTRPVEARNGGLGRGGIGAISLTARYDRIKFDSKVGQDTPFRNSRAETIFPNGDKVVTLGLQYFANRFVKIQLNGIREQVDDIERSPTLDGAAFWSTAVRFQLTL